MDVPFPNLCFIFLIGEVFQVSVCWLVFIVFIYLFNFSSFAPSGVCLLCWKSSEVVPFAQLFNVLRSPRYLVYVTSQPCSETGWTKTSPSDSFLKSWNIGHMIHSSLSSLREKHQAISALFVVLQILWNKRKMPNSIFFFQWLPGI